MCAQLFTVGLSLSLLFAATGVAEPAWAVTLGETFPQTIAFRVPGDDFDLLAPYDVVHAGPLADVEETWPEHVTVQHEAFASVHRTEEDDRVAWMYPGHWLFYAGAVVVQDLPEDEEVSVVYVDDASRFSMGEYGSVPDDIMLYALDATGAPDWTHVEQVTLLGLGDDHIVVKRGRYGSAPIAFTGGAAVAAPHAQWLTGYCSRWWMVNYGLGSPTDELGRTGAEASVAFYDWLMHGRLAHVDGVEFDAAFFKARAHRLIDVDNDRIGDGGYVEGVNVFGLGAARFAGLLRQALGPDRIIQFDSGDPARGFRGYEHVNGIEIEHFPHFNDYDAFSESFLHLRSWVARAGASPAFSYGFTKQETTVFGDAWLHGDKTDFRFRVGFASDLLLGMPHPYAKNDSDFGAFYWDEYFGGDLEDWKWLGEATGPPQQILDDLGPDQLEGLSPAATLASRPGYLATAAPLGDGGVVVDVAAVPAAEFVELDGVCVSVALPETEEALSYTVAFSAAADETVEVAGETFTVPRPIQVVLAYQDGSSDALTALVTGDLETYSLTFRVPGEALDELRFCSGDQLGLWAVTGVGLYPGSAERWARDFEGGKVLLNMARTPWVVPVGHGYRRLLGTQAPEVNDGAYTTVATVPPRDAVFLRRAAVQPEL